MCETSLSTHQVKFDNDTIINFLGVDVSLKKRRLFNLLGNSRNL